jgi:hypothetical protein
VFPHLQQHPRAVRGAQAALPVPPRRLPRPRPRAGDRAGQGAGDHRQPGRPGARIVRSIRQLELKKPPSVSETLDWARTLLLAGRRAGGRGHRHRHRQHPRSSTRATSPRRPRSSSRTRAERQCRHGGAKPGSAVADDPAPGNGASPTAARSRHTAGRHHVLSPEARPRRGGPPGRRGRPERPCRAPRTRPAAAWPRSAGRGPDRAAVRLHRRAAHRRPAREPHREPRRHGGRPAHPAGATATPSSTRWRPRW